MTSVKDFEVARAPSADGLGRGRFVFSDRYSVFDWGEMPDRVPGKGASLCTMGADNFERLESAGIPTHYRGVVADGEAVSLDDYGREAAPTEMAIDLVNVPELPREGRSYDYDAYHAAAGDYFLVPLEVVFRNAIPTRSSLRRRTDPADHGLGFEEWPDGEVTLEEPIVEFSTKYEDGDRYLSRTEAAEIAGAADLTDLERVAREVNRVITERAVEAGFRHQDGKIECLYAGGEVRVADVAGTFDENRFTYEGTQVSKEVLREYYRRTQPEWVEAVSEAKAAADERGVGDWKELCGVEPDPLPRRVVDAASGLYGAGANRYTGRRLLDAPPLDEAVEAVRELLA